MAKAFHGVRILDFTHVVSGPAGTNQLAFQGAEVIKIEPLGGESFRFGTLTPAWGEKGYSPSWVALNVNKKSISLDLKSPAGRDIIHKLTRTADVVVENFRPGVLSKLGMGYPELSEINPRLIYCAITGFGQTGPESGTPAFDGMIQALSGMMSLTGDPAGGPMRTGFALGDFIAGITAAYAIASALFQRTHTGTGQFIDVAMLDSNMAMLAQQMTEYLIAGHVQGQFGNLSASRRPTANMFPTRDGQMILSVITDKQFESFLETVGVPHLLKDPRFDGWANRIANGKPLYAEISAAMKARTTDEWEQLFRANDIPCGQVLNVKQALANPQLAHRGFINHIEGPMGPMSVIGPGFKFAHDAGGIERPPPLAGEHTPELLASLGFTADQVRDMRASKAVFF